jgi:hypothetical protein
MPHLVMPALSLPYLLFPFVISLRNPWADGFQEEQGGGFLQAPQGLLSRPTQIFLASFFPTPA